MSYQHVHMPSLPARPESEKPDDLLTINEVARLLRVDATSIRRWIRAGRIQAVRIPHMGKRNIYRIKRSEIHIILGDVTEKKGTAQ